MKRFKITKPENFNTKVITRSIGESTVTYEFATTDVNDQYNNISKYTNKYKYFEFPESNLEGYITVTSNIGIAYIYSETDPYIYIYDILLGSDNIAFNDLKTMDKSNIDETNFYNYKFINLLEWHQLVCYADMGISKTIDSTVLHPLYTKMIVEIKAPEKNYGFIDMYANSDTEFTEFNTSPNRAYDHAEIIMQNDRFDVFEFNFKTYFMIKNVDYVELDQSNPETMQLISLGNNKYYISYDNADETVKTVKFKFYAESDQLIEVL